jgi:hypothetical protein
VNFFIFLRTCRLRKCTFFLVIDIIILKISEICEATRNSYFETYFFTDHEYNADRT